MVDFPTAMALFTQATVRFKNLSCMSFSWESYLVDPASSHMLVSKIKPCMSKYKLLIL